MTFTCEGCGAAVEASAENPYPFVCPRAGDGGDHVMTPEPGEGPPDADGNPFIDFRARLAARRLLDDRTYCDLVRRLDDAVARVDGRGFRATPFGPGYLPGLPVPVWTKDETENVAGSHTALHLMGIALYLDAVEALGWAPAERPTLAIASCGNAALAAAVVARAAERRLRVFIPPDADAKVVKRLGELRAEVEICHRRQGEAGDPTYLRFLEAVADGALPFCCQGSANGLTLEGGQTLGWEMARTFGEHPVEHVVIQVGGGAFASATARALQGVYGTRAPRLHTVQTRGAAPLSRAVERLRVRASTGGLEAALAHAAAHRGEYMWPWEEPPKSVAHGILDDETYDWLRIARATLETGGESIVVSEDLLLEAQELASSVNPRPVTATGAAGLAGLLALHRSGRIAPGERAAVVFSGVSR